MLLQFIVCVFASISFAVLFAAPKSELIYCGLSGAIAWVVYLGCQKLGATSAVSNMLACFSLTVASRLFAAIRRNPATVYLISGIFPLVPGAGIYYTTYSLIMNDMDAFTSNGIGTLKTAGALVLGIIFGSSVPQSWFNAIGKIPFRRRKSQH